MGEIQSAVLGGASDPLLGGVVAALNERLFGGADHLRMAAELDGALLFEHSGKPARDLFFGNFVFEF